jgi:hypothetical protein
MKSSAARIALLGLVSAIVQTSRADGLASALQSNFSFGIAATQNQATSTDTAAYNAGFGASWWAGVPVTSDDFPTSITFGPTDGSPATVAIDVSTTLTQHPTADFYSGFTVAILNSGFGGVSIGLYYNPATPISAGTSFTATLHGGNALDGITSSATFDPNNLPAIPLFSADSYNLLTSGTYGGTESISFTDLSVPAGAETPSRSFMIEDTTGSTGVIMTQSVSDPLIHSFDFDTSLLQSGNIYEISVQDSYFIDGVGYGSAVKFDFTAVPEPAVSASAFAAIALLLAWVVRHRQRTA